MSNESDIGRSKPFRLAGVLGKINLDHSLGGVSLAQALWIVTLVSMFVFLLLPVVFAVLISFNPSDLYAFPPESITLKWYAEILSRTTWISSFVVSFQYSLLATVIAIALSSAAAYAIGRFDFAGRDLLDAGTFLPLMIPQVILGLALLLFLKNFGLVGNLLGLSLALAVYATPYATRSILTTMYNFDRSIEEAAMNLGADEIQTFRYVTFPALLPGVLTAAIFSFIVSYANLQIAIFLQGPGVIPIPVRIFAQMTFGASPVIAAVSTVNIVIVLVAIIIVERYFGAAEALGYTG
ncbi:MAG: ABC transporter permease [Halobacteriales archaeon]